MIDHLVLATPDVESSVAALAKDWGIAATPGGSHPGLGTRNALVALGSTKYLEIIGPDRDQPAPPGPRPFGIDALSRPRLVTWAASADDIDQRVERARQRGYDPGPVLPLSRTRPDGVVLEWRLTFAATVGDGLVHFLIDWGASPHPASSSATGAALLAFWGEHPRPGEITPLLDALGVELELRPAARTRLVAVVETANGRKEVS